MKKSWLISAVAGLSLFAAACGNNASPTVDDARNGANGARITSQNATGYGNGHGAYGGNYTNPSMGTSGVNAAGTSGSHFGWNTTPRTPVTGTTGTGNGFGMTGTGAGHGGAGTGANNTAFGLDRTDGYYGATSNNNGFGNNLFGRHGTNFYTFDTNDARTRSQYGPASLYTRGYGQNGSNMGTLSNTNNTSMGTGYASVSRDQLRTNATSGIYVDRNALARAVSNVAASCPGVQNATALVTDEEVFVGLTTAGNADTRTAKNQARMNAMSITPRYFKVYVTDNPDMISEMSRIASRTSNVNANTTQDQRQIDNLIHNLGGLTDGEEDRYRGRASNSGFNTGTVGTSGMTGTGTSGTTGTTSGSTGATNSTSTPSQGTTYR